MSYPMVTHDDTAAVYEAWSADGEWLGAFDTYREAREALRSQCDSGTVEKLSD